MIQRIGASALFAGVAAGLFAAVLQFAFVLPVLQVGELYESGQMQHVALVAESHDDASQDHSAEPAGAAETAAPAPDTSTATAGGVDWKRHGLTVLFTALVYCGYGLLLVAGMALADMAGHRVTARSGLIWGIAGFIAVHFAPAAGLPPELPGMAAGDVVARQAWWVGTALATAAGLALIGFGRSAAAWGLAVVLIAGPHLIGAPAPEQMVGPAPPELAALFAGRTLAVGMAVWAILGLSAAWLWNRVPEWQRA